MMYFVNILSLNRPSVSGFTLLVNAKALMGFTKFRQAQNYSVTSLFADTVLKRGPLTQHRGVSSPRSSRMGRVLLDSFLAENSAADSWHSKTNTATSKLQFQSFTNI